MATITDTSRTTHLLALMKKGDDAFNDRDFAVLDEIHHPDMVAYVTGNAEPIYGSAAHAAMVRQTAWWSLRRERRSTSTSARPASGRGRLHEAGIGNGPRNWQTV
jgi:hypothetical protein